MPREDFKSIWEEATRRYAQSSGKDFKEIPMPRTIEDLINNVEEQNGRHKHFREKQGVLFEVLSAVVTPIELVGNLAAGAASAAFPPSQMCLGAAMYLINAARGVSATLDAIMELLSDLKNYTVRLNVYLREDLSDELRGKLAEILVTVIEIFARSTKIIEDSIFGRIKMFGKNILLGNDSTMQGLITKLSELTKSEGLLVGAENLVETKRIGRVVEGVQSSMIEHSAQLTQMAGGMNQVLSAIEQTRDDAKAEKAITLLEAVKNMLHPSFLAQDTLDGIMRERVPNSGDWIRSEVQMLAWTRSKTPILWVSGNPGSGKSFLAYNIVTYLQTTHQKSIGDEKHSSVGYFFFRDNRDQTRSFEVALRNVAYQIAQTDQVYAKYVEGLSRSSPALNSIQSVWKNLFADYFIGRNTKGSSAYIVLDGIDEAFQEGRNTFFNLLNDVQKLGGNSTLHIAMLGRPQIVEEMAEAMAGSIPTIQLDRMKTSGDIARYVELSIFKSRMLSRVSDTLKGLIVRTLSAKAEGMFMWVKLMIAELGKKSRESAIKGALEKAPAGLTQMLRHVLETFSTILTEEDANDFNNMLAWVALAKRPLTLGEIDAMLRLQSPEGDAVLYLEGKIRKQYASFFTLTREDNMSTADLLNRRSVLEEGEDILTSPISPVGYEYVEDETAFNSNPSSTILSFSHSSISDFLRDPKEGKVTATGGEYPAVGVDLSQARLSLANACIDLIVDNSLLDRMQGSSSLRPVCFTHLMLARDIVMAAPNIETWIGHMLTSEQYAVLYFKQHLEELDDKLTADERVKIGLNIANMMRNQSLLRIWSRDLSYLFWKEETAKEFLRWIINPDVFKQLPKDVISWFESIQENPLELFEPAMKLFAAQWLVPQNVVWDAPTCATIISSWFLRKEGVVVKSKPALSVDFIERIASWPAFVETEYWHRRVGVVLREFKFYDAAMKHLEASLTLNPGGWLVKAGMSLLYRAQEKYKDAISSDEEVIKLLESNAETRLQVRRTNQLQAHNRIAECSMNLADELVNKATRDEVLRLRNKALENYAMAFSVDNTILECINNRFEIIRQLIRESTRSTSPELRSRGEYYGEVMKILHELDQTENGETTGLVKFLNEYYDDQDDEVFELAARAAVEKQELPWLQAKYRDAIAHADADRQEVISAILSLCLAQLYGIYGRDEDRAAKIWENLGTAPITSSAVASEIGYARTEALNQLGRYLIRKALADKDRAEKYVKRMERIVSRRRYGARTDSGDSMPPNDVALHLASWYHKERCDREARETIKPHIADAMIILSDDDPKNDHAGYLTLKQAFIAVGDDQNAFAILHALRRFKNGMAVIKAPEDYKGYLDDSDYDSDSTDQEADGNSKNDSNNPSESDSDDDDVDDSDPWYCDGCSEAWICCDGMIKCRYCNVEFCNSCHEQLLRGVLLKNICGKDHSFVTVPYLTLEQTFKEGEVLVNGKAVTVEEWKVDVKKQYGL